MEVKGRTTWSQKWGRESGPNQIEKPFSQFLLRYIPKILPGRNNVILHCRTYDTIFGACRFPAVFGVPNTYTTSLPVNHGNVACILINNIIAIFLMFTFQQDVICNCSIRDNQQPLRTISKPSRRGNKPALPFQFYHNTHFENYIRRGTPEEARAHGGVFVRSTCTLIGNLPFSVQMWIILFI